MYEIVKANSGVEALKSSKYQIGRLVILEEVSAQCSHSGEYTVHPKRFRTVTEEELDAIVDERLKQRREKETSQKQS